MGGAVYPALCRYQVDSTLVDGGEDDVDRRGRQASWKSVDYMLVAECQTEIEVWKGGNIAAAAASHGKSITCE